MTGPARFTFHTQIPRDDGCGVRVLQMLTGLPYDSVAALIDWGDRAVHYTRWEDLRGVLERQGRAAGIPINAERWSDIAGVAIVHVEGDHFLLFDADNRLFYDPGEQQGPTSSTRHSPLSYLRVG